ncbi:MAG: aminotransferase class IV [Micropruina sp.]|nr:aminotransferase class IV [Micropruina sp.]
MSRAWLNGRLVEAADAQLRIDDAGFMLGDGVFTTTIVRDGRPFALRRNLARLLSSATRVGVPAPEASTLVAAVAELLAADQVQRARLRISLSSGSAGRPTAVVSHHPLGVLPATASVVTLPWRRNADGALAGVKSPSFGEWALVQRHLAALGVDEGLFATTSGDLCEGGVSNIFLGVGGRLVTPPLSSGCLPGVTRALICEQLPVIEQALPMSVLAGAEEAFLTSAIRGVQPISLIDRRVLALAPGPLTVAAAAALASVDE